jgi:hypothetical protein
LHLLLQALSRGNKSGNLLKGIKPPSSITHERLDILKRNARNRHSIQPYSKRSIPTQWFNY